MSSLFKKLLDEAKIPSVSRNFMEHSMDIAHMLGEYKKEKGIDNKQMAEKIGTTEEQVERFLSGTHDFTFSEISNIEIKLKIVLIPILKIA